MPLLPAAPLDLPAPPPPARSLLTSARPLPGGWPGGVGSAVETQGVCPNDPGRVTLFDACEFGPADPPPDNRDVRTWQPFIARAAAACSLAVWRTPAAADRARDYLRADRSRQIAHEFWTGQIAEATDWHADTSRESNLWLANDDSVTALSGSPVHFRAALAELEQALAACAGTAMIHTTPYVATLWASLGLVQVIGADLRTTALGTVVIADAGYPGTAPGAGGGSAPATTHWAYGTTTVWRAEGDIVLSPDPGADGAMAQATWSRQNRVEWSADQPLLVLWDGCCHVGVPVDLTTP